MAKEKFHTSVREHRQGLGLTQEGLAGMVGVRRETIVFLEQGKYVPSLKLAHDISRALNAPIEGLFFFS
jgi:putative transcriptional regulator